MRVYISGPMTGIADMNFPAFHAEAERLRALGHDVVNPATLNPDPTTTWTECMRVDIAALMTCDAVQLLPGWHKSKGAMVEKFNADALHMPVFFPEKPLK